MKPFRFRLQRLLDLRQKETKMAQNALGQAQAAARQAADWLAVAVANRTESGERLLTRRQKRMTALEWRHSAELHQALIDQEKLAAQRMNEALALEAQRRAELAEAERREKVLDRLRERRADEYRLAAEAYEQAEIDEMGQNMYREGGGRR